MSRPSSFQSGALVCLLFLFSFSFALNIDSYQISAEKEGDSVHLALFIYVSNNESKPVDSVLLSIPPDAAVSSVSDFYGSLAYSKSGSSLKISFPNPIEQDERRLILVELSSSSVLSSKGGFSEYMLIFDPPRDIPEFEHTFKLPGSDKSSLQFVSPHAEVFSNNGTLMVRWALPLKAGVPQPFIVRFDEGKTDFIPFIVVLFIFLLAFFAYRLSGRYLASIKKSKLIDSLKILNERERVVVEAVVKTNGISQSELQWKFGYTKASMSKIVSKLVFREILVKRKYGKSNLLYPGKRLLDG